MSLDISLIEVKPTQVWTENITHNLAAMARAVKLLNDLTLYNVLWRPDECDPPLQKARDVIEYLRQALALLLAEPERYKEFNPSNGWGSYTRLLDLVGSYLVGCVNNPNADIRVCR